MIRDVVTNLMIRIGLTTFAKNEMAIQSKVDYLKLLGGRLINPNTTQKSYWKMINGVMNKC